MLNLLQAELKHPNAGVEKKDHEKWVVQLAELVGNPGVNVQVSAMSLRLIHFVIFLLKPVNFVMLAF